MDILYFLTAIIGSFLISLYQAFKFSKIGSDHPVHVFLASVLRENNHKFFTRVPRLLNESHCGAYPLFLHWLLSFLPAERIRLVAALLNPAMNTLQIVLVYFICRQFLGIRESLGEHAGFVSLIFALTPQFYHAFSARNYGLSSRSIGIVLLTLNALLVFQSRSSESAILYYLAIVVTGYLMWGFNTFSQQATIFFSVISGILFDNWDMLLLFTVSTIVFVVLHPRYAISYLKHTLRFIMAFEKEASPVFVLKMRYSIWRDLVYDIWIKLSDSVFEGLKYAYNNSLLIVLMLNPLAIFTVLLWFNATDMPLMITYFMQLAVTGIIVFILTSFRPTRFLGEPERYVEFVSIFSTICSTWYLKDHYNNLFVYIIPYFIVVNLVQFSIVLLINKKIGAKNTDFDIAESTINNLNFRDGVRFCANNEGYTKMMMVNAWQFARLWTVDQLYGGYKFSEAFTQFPYVNKAPFEAMVKQCRINACMLDKKNFSTIFEDDREMFSRLELVLETENYILYRLSW